MGRNHGSVICSISENGPSNSRWHEACFIRSLTGNKAGKALKNAEKLPEYPEPGEKEFFTFLENEIQGFGAYRKLMPKSWCGGKGDELPIGFWDGVVILGSTAL